MEQIAAIVAKANERFILIITKSIIYLMECVSVRVLILNIFELLFTESNRTESKLETQSNAINQNRIESNQIESIEYNM